MEFPIFQVDAFASSGASACRSRDAPSSTCAVEFLYNQIEALDEGAGHDGHTHHRSTRGSSACG